MDMINQIQGQPWQPSGVIKVKKLKTEKIKSEIEVEVTNEENAPVSRAMQINKAMLEKYGFTHGVFKVQVHG